MSELTAHQQELVDLWEKHVAFEFEEHDENRTVDTMVDDAYVNHIPTCPLYTADAADRRLSVDLRRPRLLPQQNEERKHKTTNTQKQNKQQQTPASKSQANKPREHTNNNKKGW